MSDLTTDSIRAVYVIECFNPFLVTKFSSSDLRTTCARALVLFGRDVRISIYDFGGVLVARAENGVWQSNI